MHVAQRSKLHYEQIINKVQSYLTINHFLFLFSFTKLLSSPILSDLRLWKLNPYRFPFLICSKQSSRVFFITPIFEAASSSSQCTFSPFSSLKPMQSFLHSATFSMTSAIVFSFCLEPLRTYSSLAYRSSCSSFSSSSLLLHFFLNLRISWSSDFFSSRASIGMVFWYLRSLRSSLSVTVLERKKQKTNSSFWEWQQLTEESKKSQKFCFLSLRMMSESLIWPVSSRSTDSLMEMGQSVPPSFFMTMVMSFFSSSTLMSPSSMGPPKCIKNYTIHSIPVLDLNRINQFAPNMNPLLLSFSAHIEGALATCIAPPHHKLFSLGQDDLLIAWNTEDMTERREIELNNNESQQFTCIAYSSLHKVFAMGTRSGKVLLASESDTSQSQIGYMGNGAITSLLFSEQQNYLAIGLKESKAVAYNAVDARFIRCSDGHEGAFALYATLNRAQTHFISMGSDGYINIYSIQNGSLDIQERFRVATSNLEEVMSCSERPGHPGMFAVGGSTTLQQIQITPTQTDYKVKAAIHEKAQILKCEWINAGALALLTKDSVFIWDYSHSTKILALNNVDWVNILTDGIRFFGTDARGLVYRYESSELMARGLEEQAPEVEGVEQDEESEKSAPKQQKRLRKKRERPEISIAATIITEYPQAAIESSYAGYLENRFMFYNHIGCIIERSDGNTGLMELEYHDKFKLRRIKFESQSRTLFYYALTEDCFMYAGRNHAYFEREVPVYNEKGASRDKLVDRWDYCWEDIEGVSLGSDWAAIVSKSQIKIFDYSGNEIHSIAFDRPYLAMATFEDQFVIAYNSAIPMSSSRIFEMKFYRITLDSWKLERIVSMPIRSEYSLNWFGYSQEGILFMQDTSETVRMYMWNTNEWIDVYQGNDQTHNLFIQHIENYEIFGFKIELKEGEPAVPTVLPRSLPRKINLELPGHSLPFLSPDENHRLRDLHLRKYILQQEQFRNQRWYRFKYSRGHDHPRYKNIASIQSDEQLEVMTTQIDMLLVKSIEKLLPALEERKSEDMKEIKLRLYSLSFSLASFPETVSKLKKLLMAPDNTYFLDADDRMSRMELKQRSQVPPKYGKLSRLSAMVDMGWLGQDAE